MSVKLFVLLFSTPLFVLGQNTFIYQFPGNKQNQDKIHYWENGKILSQLHYINGKREGECKYWYKSGQLMKNGCYKNGKMSGPFISYYENGQIESQGTFKYSESTEYSRKDGVWKYYYENGQLQSESVIKNGVEELKFYDKKGNLKSKGDGC